MLKLTHKESPLRYMLARGEKGFRPMAALKLREKAGRADKDAAHFSGDKGVIDTTGPCVIC